MWGEIIDRIRAATNLTDQGIADRISEQTAGKVSVSQMSINRIRRNKQNPSYELGAEIMKLRDEFCGTANENVA